MFSSPYMPCPDCGASVERSDTQHACDSERLLDYQMFRMREEIESLQLRFSEFLETAQGQFERWLAERDVRLSR